MNTDIIALLIFLIYERHNHMQYLKDKICLCKNIDVSTCFQNNCNVQPSRATANPVGGKACSPTKGGLLRYIPNTYSIHKVSSLKFAYFQERLSRHITSPSEKTWPRDYMGKATPVWQLSSSHRCHQM